MSYPGSLPAPGITSGSGKCSPVGRESLHGSISVDFRKAFLPRKIFPQGEFPNVRGERRVSGHRELAAQAEMANVPIRSGERNGGETVLNYDRLADDYARYRKTHPRVLSEILMSIPGTAARVLEVGCGTANYLATLAELTGAHCAGIDPSAEMLAKAREKRVPLELTLGRAEQLPFDGDSFSLVFSVDVIHHVQDRAGFYGEAFRVLAPGGRVCTATDSEWVIRRRVPLTSHFPETVEQELKRYPSADSLKTMMHEAGFTSIVEDTVEFHYQLRDAAPYRNKAFSSLHLISEDAFRAGIERLERDLAKGPLDCLTLYTVIWGTKA